MENKEELELLKMLSEAEKDVKNGRTAPIEDTFEEVRKKLNQDSRLLFEIDLKKYDKNAKKKLLKA